MAAYSSSVSGESSTLFQNAPTFAAQLNQLPIRLDRHNFVLWRSQVLPTVRAHGFDGILFGTTPTPAQFIESRDEATQTVIRRSNPQYENWLRYDQFLMSWLFSSISESMLGHVNRCRSSAEVWFTIDRLNSTTSKARSLQLRFLLQTTKKGSMTIDEYVLKMKSILDNHNASGQIISDDELILYILGGVGQE